MSEGTTPSISISALTSTLNAALTADRRLTLNQATLGDHAVTEYVLGFLEVAALTLSAAEVSPIEGGVSVSGRASFFSLSDLAMTVAVTAPDGGIGLSMRATPTGAAALSLGGLSGLQLAAVALDVTWTNSARTISGVITGSIRLGSIDVPISIQRSTAGTGFVITGAIDSGSRPGISGLAGLIAEQELLPALPDGLGDLLKLRDFTIQTGQARSCAVTLISTQLWEIIPDTLAIESVELLLEALLPTENRPLVLDMRPKAVLRLGAHRLPITLSRAEDSDEWAVDMTGAEIPLPGLTDLAQLLGGAEQLESMMPGLGGFPALSLNAFQLRFDPKRRVLRGFSAHATAQQDFSVPAFDALSLQRPTLFFAVEELNPPPPPPPPPNGELPSDLEGSVSPPRVPSILFKLASAQAWEIVPGSVSTEGIALGISVLLPTANRPRSVRTRIETLLRLGAERLPITVSKESATAWLIELGSTGFPLPDLKALAQLFGGNEQLEAMLPGLGDFGRLSLTGLQLRIDRAQRTISALSFKVAAQEWKPSAWDGLVLQEPTVLLSIQDPLRSTRAVTGSVDAIVVVSNLRLRIGARKTSPGADWQLEGLQIGAAPLSLTALVGESLGGALPSGVPEVAFVDVRASLTPRTGEFTLGASSAAPLVVPLGFTDLSLTNVSLLLHRRIVNNRRAVSLQVGGDLSVGGVAVSLAFALPGTFKLSAALPAVSLLALLNALGCGALLTGLGLPTSYLGMTIGPGSLTIDAVGKTVSLSAEVSGFGALELQVRRDARGKLGAALALAPTASADLQSFLGVPGLGSYPLSNLVFVLSSLHDPSLVFTQAAFASAGPVTRGFGFSARISIAALGVGVIPGLPTAPIAVQARFGHTLSDFTLAAALSAPGDRFILDPKSGLCLLDPELRISPATSEVCVAGRLEVILDGKKLEFAGGFKLAGGSAALFATLKGDWVSPFGLSGVVARDLSLQLNLPGLPSLAGTLQMGRTTGAVLIKPDPTAPVFDLKIGSLDLHDLITGVCDPALLNVPAEFAQLLADVRIENAQIYMAPRDTTIGDIQCPAGVSVAGKMFAWGLEIDAYVRTLGSGPLKSLQATGAVKLPDLGGVLVLASSFDGNGAPQGKPSFQLLLEPGKVPVVRITAAVRVLGVTAGSVHVSLNDAGFTLAVSGLLIGGQIRATLNISGGRLAPDTKYAVAAELDPSSITALLNKAKDKIDEFVKGANSEITRARNLLTDVDRKAAALTQEKEDQRKAIQAARDKDAADLRAAESNLQTQIAKVAALSSSADQARALVLAERAEVDRRIAAARRDVDAAVQSVSSLTGEINATNRWFYGLPKVAVPWQASQAREGVWFGIKMGGLYAARATAQGALDIASRALQAISDTQRSFPVDLDPRVAGIVAAKAVADQTLATAQASVATLRESIKLIPVDADFRLVALDGLQQAQVVQRIAAQSALDLAEKSLDGLAKLGASLAPAVTINRAYFASELSALQGGKVRLGVDITTSSGSSSFTVGLDLNDLTSAVTELVNRLLGTDTSKTISAVVQSTNTAASTIAQVEVEVLPTNQIVTLRNGGNGQLLRVMGANPLRYGDTISLRAGNGCYLVAENWGVVNVNRGELGPWERWIIHNPSDLSSTDYIRYGDTIALCSWHNKYLGGSGATIWGNRSPLTSAEHWVILHADDFNRRDGVDTSHRVALRNSNNVLLGALGGGGDTAFAWNPTAGAWETWTMVVPTSAALSYCLDARGTSNTDAACQFQVKRSGDWIGFLSQRSNRFLTVAPNQPARASSLNFVEPGHSAEHFRLEGSALFNQSMAQYLHLSDAPANAPRFVDAAGTVRTDLVNMFVIAAAPPPLPSTSTGTVSAVIAPVSAGPAPVSGVTANDLATALQQKDAVSGVASAAAGPGAERSAATQAAQTGQVGLQQIEPVRLALAQAEADRRARRERAIERAARGTRPASAGWRDSALRFDGQSYLEAPTTRAVLLESPTATSVTTAPVIALGTSFTVEAWVHPEALVDDHASILGKWAYGNDDELLFSITKDGYLSLAWHVEGASTWGIPGWFICQSTETLKLDAWSHVAAVRSGDTVSLYIDGRPVGGATGLGTAPLRAGTTPWRVGVQSAGVRRFIGVIDSIRIWSVAQSAAMLRAQRYVVSTGDEAGLLTCWNFDEESGDTAYDCGPRELHARLSSGVHRSSPGGPESPPLPDRHLTLSGGAHAVIGEVDLFAGSTAMAIAAWVRIDRISGDVASILSKWGLGTDCEFMFGVVPSGKLIFAWRTQGGSSYGTPGWDHVFSEGTVPQGRYCHVAAVREGKAIRFYCDGEPSGASDVCDELPLRRSPVPICIGSERGQLRFFEGSLAEVRVFRRAVSGEEVRETYRRPLSGDVAGLAALWQLDEGWGSVVRDAGPNGHAGTLVGPASWPGRGGPPRIAGPTRGLQLSGSQYIELGDDDLFTSSLAITLESWVRPDSIVEDFTSIINKWKQGPDSEYLFGLMPDGRLAFAWHTQGGDSYGTPSFGHVFSERKITLARWTHVAVVRAGKTITFYMEGQSAGSFDAADMQPFHNSTATLRIGAEGGGTQRFFRGTLANLRIWSVARTPDQLSAGMQGFVGSRETGLLLDLRFDEGEGTKVLDSAHGEIGHAVGALQFVPVTLPLRTPAPIAEPIDRWLQPALDAAANCRDTGVALASAIPEVEAALAQLERPNRPRLVALLARAGYAAEYLGVACVQSFGLDATQVAQLYFSAGRPANEALLAIDGALNSQGRSSQIVATAMASAAGYTPEALGTALQSAWGLDAQRTGRLVRDAGLPCVTTARAVWAALERDTLPSFTALVGHLLSAGHSLTDVSQALAERWGVDAWTVARAGQRAVVVPPPALDLSRLREVYVERPSVAPSVFYNFSTRSEAEASAAGWKREMVAFVAFSEAQPGTVPIYRETALSNPGKHFHFWHRTPTEAAVYGWQQLEVAFHAFKVQQPGTVPVYREEEPGGRSFFSVRDTAVARTCGWERVDIAFYAYPADTLNPPTAISLRAHGGQFVAADPGDARTMAARLSAMGGWERFGRIELGQGRIALRTSDGKYVRAEGGGGGALSATATSIGAFETFNPIDLGTGSIALQSSNGKYVCAEGGGGQALVANRDGTGPWESFACVRQPPELNWATILGGLRCVGCGADGTVWGVNSSQQIFRWLGGNDWQHIAGGLVQISVGSASQVWGVNNASLIYRWTPGGWVQIPGSMKQVAAAADGTVWSLDSNEQIYRWTGSAWEHIPGGLVQIWAGSASQVWGVNNAGMIFRWTPSGWEQIPGTMKQIAAAADGTVYGVTPANAVVRWRGGAQWEALDVNLTQVAVGPSSLLWGVTDSDQIVRGTPRLNP